MTTFVTADQHFCHERIIALCNRPFSSVEEMDQTMMDNWRQVVLPGDTVYVLGDFAWSKLAYEALCQILPGNIIFLAGSHDWNRKKLPLMLRITENKVTMYLSHWPLASWQPNTWMLHGHSHGKLPKIPKRVDVGVDVWGFRPVSIEEIWESEND